MPVLAKTRVMMKSNPTTTSSAMIQSMRTKGLPGNALRSLVWNMPQNISPDTKRSSAPTRTGITATGTKNSYGYLFLSQKTYFSILFSYSIPNQIIFIYSKVTDNTGLSIKICISLFSSGVNKICNGKLLSTYY